MVSAVFHSPQEAAQVLGEARAVPAKVVKAPAVAVATVPRDPYDWRGLLSRLLPPIIGMALLVAIWALLTMKGGAFPTPAATFDAAVKLFANPFYQKGPNNQGIGWNILFSLQRVAVGFGLAALVGIDRKSVV